MAKESSAELIKAGSSGLAIGSGQTFWSEKQQATLMQLGVYFNEVEITDDLAMLQCIECGYMAGPGYDLRLGVDDESVASFNFHDCESEKADAEWYHVDA